MPLETLFEAAQTDLLIQQNPVCRITIRNTGNEPVEVLDPNINQAEPVFRIIEVKSGIEILHKPETFFDQKKFNKLAPGKTVQYEFGLLDKVHLTLPVEYEVSVLLSYGTPLSKVETNPVRFKIRTLTPKYLSLAGAHGGWSAALYGACLNLAPDPPEIVRYQLMIGTNGGAVDAQPIAPASLRSAPVISSTANKTVGVSQWIAWIDKDKLRAVHYGPDYKGAFKPVELNLADASAQIIAPLHMEPDPEVDPPTRPAGAALLWIDRPADHTVLLQMLGLTVGGIKPAGSSVFPGPKPNWSQSIAHASGKRLVLFAQSTGAKTTLSSAPWPSGGNAGPGVAATAPTKVAGWDAEFIGCGALMQESDSIAGAALLYTKTSKVFKLELVYWKLDEAGKFTEGKRFDIPWAAGDEIRSSTIRIGSKGEAAALVENTHGVWKLIDPMGKVEALPGAYATTKLPVDIAFLRVGHPVLIVGQIGQGLDVIEMDGNPLPHKCG